MPLTEQDIENRTTYHEPTKEAVFAHTVMRKVLEGAITEVNRVCPDSREKSLAITNLEQAMMWANAAIARNHDKLIPG